MDIKLNKSLPVIALLGATLLAVPAFACSGGPGGSGGWSGSRHAAMQQRMADELKLSDEQREHFRKIHEDGREAMQAGRDSMQANRDAMRKLDASSPDFMARASALAAEKGKLVEEMMLERARIRARTEAILTPEQRVKHSQLREERQRKWKDRRGKGGWGGGPDDGRGPRGM